MGAETARNVSAFRVFRTRLRDAFADLPQPVRLDRRAADLGHDAVRGTPCPARTAAVGQSNYTVRKLVTHAFNMMTGFSTLPLQWRA